MNGNQQYELLNLNKINNLIDNSVHKDILLGFKNYMNKLSSSSIYRYLIQANNFMNYINKPIYLVEFDDFTMYINTLSSKTPSYQIQVYSALKKFSTYLYRSKKINDDVAAMVERPAFFETEGTIKRRENSYLTRKEAKIYRNAVKNGVGSHRQKVFMEKERIRDLAIVDIFLTTGIRCSALYKLDINSINFNTGCIITTDKGRKVKEHKLPESVLVDLANWLSIRENMLAGKQEDALFISRSCNRLSTKSISNIVSKYAVDIKGKHISPHKLRATFGTTLLEETGNLYLTQKAMNHSSPKTTELYIRGQDKALQKQTAEAISVLLT